MVDCFLGGFGHDRHVKAFSDDVGNFSERNALVSNPVKRSSRGSLLKYQPEKVGSIEAMHGGPAIESVAYIR